MKFQATEEQVKQIFCNAVNASIPIGMGFLHFQEKEYKCDDVKLHSSGIGADYFQGRMVKLEIKRLGETEWEITRPKYPPNVEYQSWVMTYPTLETLINSVTIQESKETGPATER